jgi:hypothetical protein
VWDKDFYSPDDAIGVVSLDLNPLLLAEGADKIDGWFPIYDTTSEGAIRGHLKVSVKVQFFGDVNPFNNSAAGVRFLSVSQLQGFDIVAIRSFVEELLVEHDPEYHWSERFRASRTSNEARQILFNQLTNKIRRSVGSKAVAMGANAVLGYRHVLDLEQRSGVIARASGTACSIVKCQVPRPMHDSEASLRNGTHGVNLVSQSPLKSSSPLQRKESKRETGFIDSLYPSPEDVQLLTLDSMPPNVQVQWGGLVAARSIKLLASKNAQQRTRDKWWAQLRGEVKSHAVALDCDFVLGYAETCDIFEDICVRTLFHSIPQHQ